MNCYNLTNITAEDLARAFQQNTFEECARGNKQYPPIVVPKWDDLRLTDRQRRTATCEAALSILNQNQPKGWKALWMRLKGQ